MRMHFKTTSSSHYVNNLQFAAKVDGCIDFHAAFYLFITQFALVSRKGLNALDRLPPKPNTANQQRIVSRGPAVLSTHQHPPVELRSGNRKMMQGGRCCFLLLRNKHGEKEEGQQGREKKRKKEDQMVTLLTVDGSGTARGYDPNGKERRTEGGGGGMWVGSPGSVR